jgi:N-acetylglucosamine-6-sulfatase
VRRAAGALLAFALVLGGCGASPEPGQQTKPGQPTKPNVLVILTDDQTVESMRVMAGVRSELGAAGTTFERSFVSNPLCCPSRATLYTGQYTHNHGVIGNRPPEGGYGRLDKSEWLPVWLQRAGYHTVHIGKFMNRYGQDSPPTEVPPGWNEWYTSVDPSTYSFYGYTLNENGALADDRAYLVEVLIGHHFHRDRAACTPADFSLIAPEDGVGSTSDGADTEEPDIDGLHDEMVTEEQ